jgi:hypothetical protein
MMSVTDRRALRGKVTQRWAKRNEKSSTISKRPTYEIEIEHRPEAPLDHKMVEAMAYQLWLKRGLPIGMDQVDWYQGEAELTSANWANPRALPRLKASWA